MRAAAPSSKEQAVANELREHPLYRSAVDGLVDDLSAAALRCAAHRLEQLGLDLARVDGRRVTGHETAAGRDGDMVRAQRGQGRHDGEPRSAVESCGLHIGEGVIRSPGARTAPRERGREGEPGAQRRVDRQEHELAGHQPRPPPQPQPPQPELRLAANASALLNMVSLSAALAKRNAC